MRLSNYLKITPLRNSIIGDPREQEMLMGEHSAEEKPLPTIWRVPDGLWERIEPILKEHDPPKKTRRPRVDQVCGIMPRKVG